MEDRSKVEDKNLTVCLQQSLRQEVQPERLDETIRSCIEIMREQKVREEPRTGFFRYLSDVFRFEGILLLGLQAATLLLVCLAISNLADVSKWIPLFIPLFVLAVMPVIFKSQFYGMSEMEAATRASGAQIILAKLVLAGAANLVCITILLFVEVDQQNTWEGIGQMILYCLVPYLACMAALLRIIRLRRREGIQMCMFVMLGSCVFWGLTADTLPWLYEASAAGLWILSFLVFSAFFINEIHYIAVMRKEGKMYGIVA